MHVIKNIFLLRAMVFKLQRFSKVFPSISLKGKTGNVAQESSTLLHLHVIESVDNQGKAQLFLLLGGSCDHLLHLQRAVSTWRPFSD